MPRQSRWTAPATLVLVLVAALALGACGGSEPAQDGDRPTSAAAQCREQWHDVAQTVLGMDQDNTPSALASRWTSVIATVDYYENAGPAKDCQATIETQEKAIGALRQFSDRLRRYDVGYQLRQVEPSIQVYLSDPLPAAVAGVQPPAKPQVAQALADLQANAAAANTDLEAGWGQAASVDLNDPAAVEAAEADLKQLALDSPAWMQSNRALRVLQAALRAQNQG